MPEPEILRLLAQFRNALSRQDEIALQQVINAYRMLYSRLGGRIDALIQAAGAIENLTGPKLIRLAQYKELEAQLLEELSRFGIFLETHVTSAARAALIGGETDTYRLLRLLTGRAPLRVGFQSLNIEAIQTMIGFLQPESPLFKAIQTLAPYYTEQVMKGLVSGIGMGNSPRVTAQLLARAFENELGQGLTSALRITRTAQLYSYREANRANFVANSDVVTGWYWVADMNGDPPPCLSCIAENGTRHDLDENLDDHDNGRCAMVPEIMGQNPIEDMETGEEWFNGLSEARQQELMGEGRFTAWKEGKFEFGALSQQVEHPTWGHVRSVTPLKELIGESESE